MSALIRDKGGKCPSCFQFSFQIWDGYHFEHIIFVFLNFQRSYKRSQVVPDCLWLPQLLAPCAVELPTGVVLSGIKDMGAWCVDKKWCASSTKPSIHAIDTGPWKTSSPLLQRQATTLCSPFILM